MLLITEQLFDPLSLITEADASGKKHLYIQGPFAVADHKNRNGRVYKKELMENVINRYNEEYIKTNRALGEMNHPPRLNIDYERATHLTTEMKQDGNVWIGKAKVLKTPMGKVLEGLLESGVSIGVSTRGAGTITEAQGIKHVNPDFVMAAVDVVSDPSALLLGPDGKQQGAFVQGILEGVSFAYTDKGFEIVDQTKASLIEAYNKKVLDEKRALLEFTKFMTAMKQL